MRARYLEEADPRTSTGLISIHSVPEQMTPSEMTSRADRITGTQSLWKQVLISISSSFLDTLINISSFREALEVTKRAPRRAAKSP